MSKREAKRNVPPGKKSQAPAPTAPLDAEAVTWTPFFERLGLRMDGSRPRPSVRDVERAFEFWRTLPDRMRRKGWPGGTSAAERLNRLGTWQRAAQDILTAEAERLGLDSSSIRESGEACYSLLRRQPRFADKTTPQSQVAYWPHCLGERLAGLSAQEKEAVRAGERVLGRLLARVRLEKQGGDDWITSSVAERKQPHKKKRPKDRFRFAPGQAFFDDHDLGLPTGLPVKVLKKLVKGFGRTVRHQNLHAQSTISEASPELRHAIRVIGKALKAKKTGYQVHSKHGEGYVLS